MPRRKGRIYKKDIQAIAERLGRFVRRFDKPSEFSRRFRVPRTTLRTWTQAGDVPPAIPDSAYLLMLAEEGNLNLNWLFLGEGSELRQRETTTPQGALMAAIAAELRTTEEADEADHEQAWARLAMYGPDSVFRLAVEAVRPLYHQALLDVEHAQASAHNLKQVYKAVLAETGMDLDDEGIRERVLDLGVRAEAELLKVPPRPFVVRPLRLYPEVETKRET